MKNIYHLKVPLWVRICVMLVESIVAGLMFNWKPADPVQIFRDSDTCLFDVPILSTWRVDNSLVLQLIFLANCVKFVDALSL